MHKPLPHSIDDISSPLSINLDHRAAGNIGSFFIKFQQWGKMEKTSETKWVLIKKSNHQLNNFFKGADRCPHSLIKFIAHCSCSSNWLN